MLSVKKFTFNPFEENTYLLYDENGDCAIIDPGCYTDAERQALQSFIADRELRPVYLINTHCHLDHVFGNRFVSKTWQLPLYLHEGEQPVLAFAPQSAAMYGLTLDRYTGPKHFLTEGDVLHIGDNRLDILLTPGHSPASISCYNAADGYLIAGDVLFAGSIGRTDLPGGDYDTLERSIRTKFYTLPDQVKVYPGHGPGTSIGYEKQHNSFVRAD